MRSIEIIDGVIGYRSDIPTVWWTLHEKVTERTDDDGIKSRPSVIATDDMFRLVAGQHMGKVELHPLTESMNWYIRDVGTLWMIYIVSGVAEFSVQDQITSTDKVLMAGMGVLGGGDVTFNCKVVQSGVALFVKAR